MEPLRSAVGTNRTLARREVSELWGEGNLDLVDELYAERVTRRTSDAASTVVDRETLRDEYEAWLGAFPDGTVTVLDEVADRDIVIQRVRLRGTHAGAFFDLEPTGRSVDVRGFLLRRFRDGRVVAAESLFDESTMRAQLDPDGRGSS